MQYADFKQIKEVHIDALFSEENKFRCYKNISLAAVLSEITLLGDWCEFGVYRGEFATMLQGFCAGDPKRRLYLFDSFEGLPSDWTGTEFRKGAFALQSNEMPRFDAKTTTVMKGWFDDTVPAFVKQHPQPLSFIHIDCDLHSSTRTVLDGCASLIVPGTVLLFDEFFLPGPKGISDDECRAFHDWAQAHGRQFQILWKTRWVQCAIRILK